MAEALLPPYDAAGIVEQLRTATQRQNRTRAVQLCTSLIGLNDLADNVAAHRAGAASALAEVLDAWQNDALVTQASLCGLFHAWAGGVPPFHDATDVPTERILQAIVDSLRRHQSELYVAQAATRILKMHAASTNRLLLLPAVMEAIELAMKSWPADDSVQHWSAQALCHLHNIPHIDIVQTHGRDAYTTICTKTLALADGALRPATLFLAHKPWYDAIVDILAPTSVNSRQ